MGKRSFSNQISSFHCSFLNSASVGVRLHEEIWITHTAKPFVCNKWPCSTNKPKTSTTVYFPPLFSRIKPKGVGGVTRRLWLITTVTWGGAPHTVPPLPGGRRSLLGDVGGGPWGVGVDEAQDGLTEVLQQQVSLEQGPHPPAQVTGERRVGGGNEHRGPWGERRRAELTEEPRAPDPQFWVNVVWCNATWRDNKYSSLI